MAKKSDSGLLLLLLAGGAVLLASSSAQAKEPSKPPKLPDDEEIDDSELPDDDDGPRGTVTLDEPNIMAIKNGVREPIAPRTPDEPLSPLYPSPPGNAFPGHGKPPASDPMAAPMAAAADDAARHAAAAAVQAYKQSAQQPAGAQSADPVPPAQSGVPLPPQRAPLSAVAVPVSQRPAVPSQATQSAPKPPNLPAGYDPATARRGARSLAAHLKRAGRAGYDRRLLEQWQRQAGMVPDRIYGGGTRGALLHYGVAPADAPQPFFAPFNTTPYVPPEKR